RDRARHGRVAGGARAAGARGGGPGARGGRARPARRSRDLGDGRRPARDTARARADARGLSLCGRAGDAPRGARGVRGGRVHRLPGGTRAARGGGMSAVMRQPAVATAGAPGHVADDLVGARTTADSLVLRLVAFTALGAFAAAHWGALVSNPPVGRTLLVLVIATGGAAALGLFDRAPVPRPAIHAAAAVIALVT